MRIRLHNERLLPASARRPALFRRACLRALGPKGRRKSDLNIIFLDRKEMKKLNTRFLGHRWDTDVIAFPYTRDRKLPPGSPFGDVFVSASLCRVQAKRLGHSVLKEALTLAVHGTLHLAGYKDSAPKLKARMFRRQDAILKSLKAA